MVVVRGGGPWWWPVVVRGGGGGGPWWWSVVVVRGGGPWWWSVVVVRGGGPWWSVVVRGGCRRCRRCDSGRRGPGRYLMAARFARCLDLRGGKRVVAEVMPQRDKKDVNSARFNSVETLSIGSPKIQQDLLKSTFPRDSQSTRPRI